MARKFNVGRQNELLLNEELHNLFMALKYLNFERYDEYEDVYQEHQTEIPNHALRLKLEDNIDKLLVHYPGLSEDNWKPVFKGFYHPANTRMPSIEEDKVPYQLCIDPDTGTIMYWDTSIMDWNVAYAKEYTGEKLNTFNGLNFQFIHPLSQYNNFYPVPFTNFGKLFDGDRKYIPFTKYKNENDCAISGIKGDNNSWVHVNATKLSNIEKRLIKVHNPTTADPSFIGIMSTQTEFYSFTKNNKLGKLLIKDIDYVDTIGGITLLNHEEHEYIYTITYTFDERPSTQGGLLRKTDVIGQQNEIYIGETTENITLFLDGLSLEETDEQNKPLYTYNRKEGTIIFSDLDDAEVINNMQLTTIMFPNKTAEISFSSNSPSNQVVHSGNKTAVRLTAGNNVNEYKTPMLFCSGLGLQETNIYDDFTIKNGMVVINNFTLIKDEVYKLFIADVGDSFVCKGILNGSTINDSKIKQDNLYIVFINGILMTPTNGDISVIDGSITITDAENSRYDELHYVVFEMDDSDDSKMGLVYDELVTSYSIRIDDNGAPATYDNCNSAVVYITKGNESGILLDEDSVTKPVHALEGYYKGGQIIRTTDMYGNNKYYMYDYTADEPRVMEEEEIEEVFNMFGYFSTAGSIHLLDGNQSLVGATIAYYAYSFANQIDEKMIADRKNNLVIPPVSSDDTIIYAGSAKRLETWRAKTNALSTHINGLIVESKEDQIVEGVTRSYTIEYPGLRMNFNKNYYKIPGVKDIDAEMIKILNAIYDIYGQKKIEEILAQNILNQTLLIDESSKYLIKDLFVTTAMFSEAWHLAKYIFEDMTQERTSYIIEEIERNETISVYKDYIYLETGKNDTRDPQIYQLSSDTVEADFPLVPGFVNVYVNGVRLDDSEFVRFDNNKIMFDIPVCGVQDLPVVERMTNSLPDHLSNKKVSEDLPLDIVEYRELMNYPQITRIIEDKLYYIPVSNRDTVLIERRPDTSIKTATFDVLIPTYNSLDFNQDYYDIPSSLINSIDLIKIYINGVYYDGEYVISDNGGIKGIKLLDYSALKIDPLYEYFNRYPEELELYKAKYNKEYKRRIDKITFEWR